jgi:hypothetical protein
MCEIRELEEAVINREKSIIDTANEGDLPDKGEHAQDLLHFKFVLEAAWDHNDDISSDEQNLINKIKDRFNISDYEYRVIEAIIGNFPKPENQVHLRSEIDSARRILQSMGFLTSVRDDDGINYDVIPVEIAESLRKVLGIEIRNHGYRELLNYKTVRRKDYYSECLKKTGFKPRGNESSSELQELVMRRVSPSIILGGTTPRDGLSMDQLGSWCQDLGLPSSAPKNELLARIIHHYDNLRQHDNITEDDRGVWYAYYDRFAARDHQFLRGQQLIDKDLEIERKFEQATDYLFEVKLGHKPLNLVGSEHADGILSLGQSVILWDNKSKETNVHLGDHIKQFDRYISSSEKRIGGFLVIGPSFTDESASIAMKYFVEQQTMITLITATELKELAETWSQKGKEEKSGSFPLGFLIQQGRFNRSMVDF